MQTFQSLETDFKAEVIGAAMLTKDADIGHILIERLGSNSRPHTKDILRIYEDTGLYNLNEQLVIQSYRQSIYDAVPENVFHPPTLGGIGKTAGEIVEEIQLQRQREKDARKFFSPFEQEASYIEMQALALELMYELKGSFDNLFDLFEQAWPILRKLPRATGLAFIYMLPVLHRIRGNRAWAAQCFAYILGFPVTITEVYGLENVADGLGCFTTGSAQLGITTTFGGYQYDGEAAWHIDVGPVPHKDMAMVLPHTDFYGLLLLLSDYFIPAGLFVHYAIRSGKEQPTLLNAGDNAARLNYTFFL